VDKDRNVSGKTCLRNSETQKDFLKMGREPEMGENASVALGGWRPLLMV